jgi:hypothetical protein
MLLRILLLSLSLLCAAPAATATSLEGNSSALAGGSIFSVRCRSGTFWRGAP